MSTFITKRIAAQLRRPAGAFGRLVMTRMLNRGNTEIIEGTLEALGLETTDAYLDVGFGGGRSLTLAAEAIGEGHIYGVDFSADVVTAAQRRHRALIGKGRLTLLTANVVDIPLRDALVTKISTINTIYFWPKPREALRSLRRLLAPGGHLAIGFTGADKMRAFDPITRHGFRIYDQDEVSAALDEAGFVSIDVIPQHGRRSEGDFVVRGRRPTSF